MAGGGNAYLVFYEKGEWREEHPLNTIAAWATNSKFSHVEIAIGNEHNEIGAMSNVLRVFNDNVGVELTERTGKNPSFSYLQLGCTKLAEQSMLAFARQQVGKPFSMSAMLRSIVWPRHTTGDSYFCAELVAATLQTGGLLSADSNPGAATPESLYKMYKDGAACCGNPYILRKIAADRDAEVGQSVSSRELFSWKPNYTRVATKAPAEIVTKDTSRTLFHPPMAQQYVKSNALVGMFRMPVDRFDNLNRNR